MMKICCVFIHVTLTSNHVSVIRKEGEMCMLCTAVYTVLNPHLWNATITRSRISHFVLFCCTRYLNFCSRRNLDTALFDSVISCHACVTIRRCRHTFHSDARAVYIHLFSSVKVLTHHSLSCVRNLTELCTLRTASRRSPVSIVEQPSFRPYSY